jgi:hypothetical protein
MRNRFRGQQDEPERRRPQRKPVPHISPAGEAIAPEPPTPASAPTTGDGLGKWLRSVMNSGNPVLEVAAAELALELAELFRAHMAWTLNGFLDGDR